MVKVTKVERRGDEFYIEVAELLDIGIGIKIADVEDAEELKAAINGEVARITAAIADELDVNDKYHILKEAVNNKEI